MKISDKIPGSMDVNHAISLYPETISIFNDFGIDACCGGAVPIAEAALRDGADLDELMAALAAILEEAP